MGYALVALAAISWGTWGFILRAAEKYGPIDARIESAIVMIVITLFGFALVLVERTRPREHTKPTIRQWLGVAWLGFADAMNVMLLFAAYGKTRVSIAVTTHYLAPLFVSAAAPLVLRERGHARTYAAVFVGFVGLVLLLRPWAGIAERDLAGAMFGAGSAAFYASNVLVNKRLVRAFTGIELMAFHGVVATPVLLLLARNSAWEAVTWPAVAILVGGGIVPGTLGGIFFVWALRRIPATHAATLTLLEPLVAVFLAVLFLHERLSPISYVGAAMILVGAATVMRRSV